MQPPAPIGVPPPCRSALDYAPEGSEVRAVLQRRLADLQAVADKRQADLLADLMEGAAVQPSGSRSKVGLADLGDALVPGSGGPLGRPDRRGSGTSVWI